MTSSSATGSAYATTCRIPATLTDGPEKLTSLHGGTYYFYAVQWIPAAGSIPGYSDTEILRRAEFKLMDIATAAISSNNGYVGDEVIITGSGFARDEALIIEFANRDISGIVGNPYTGNNGTLEMVFDIPESLNGLQKIKITGEESGASFEFNYTVKPRLTVTPVSGQGGTKVTINGTGFAYRNGIILFVDGIAVASTDLTWIMDGTYKRTTNLGSFTLTMDVPGNLTPGIYVIKAEDEDNVTIKAETSFQVLLNSILALSTSTGNVGSAVTVTGTNFAPNTALNILFDTRTIGNVTTDALGNFSKEITIPAAACGVHIIKVGDSQQNYTVTSKMTLDKTQGVAGTTVTATGSGFAAGTTITAKFNGAAVALTSTVTDVAGNFTTSFTVPAIATGTYVVEIAAGNVLTANFNILETEVVDPAAIALNTSTVKVGDIINITGTNFAAGANIALTIDGDAVFGATPITTTTNGAFATSLIIPTIAGGAHTLSVTDGTNTKTVQFTVTAKASMTPTSGNVGSSVTVSGDGFIANTNLTIKYDGVAVANAILPLTGAFINTAFTVPASAGGAHTVAVTDGINTVELTFTMETTAPSKPALTAPSSASKEKGIVTFDWDDSTDDSMPVTYTLQVATDAAFTGIIFTQTGLTASTYTLTEAQKLDKLPDGGSYYWRVIAKDAANNSVTSDVSTFVVGGSLPGWLMWVWIGIGVVVVFIFAVWLGRRMAYSSY